MQQKLEKLISRLEEATGELKNAKSFSKQLYLGKVLDFSRQLLKLQNGGVEAVYRLVPELDNAGVFQGTDWDHPELLQASLVGKSLDTAQAQTVVAESLNLLRMLAITEGKHFHVDISDDRAKFFLQKVLAMNLSRIMGQVSEADRNNPYREQINHLFQFIVEKAGHGEIVGQLIEEIWRVLRQRPIKVDVVREMISNIGLYWLEGRITDPELEKDARKLISALYGPTPHTVEDPGFELYRQRLEAMELQDLEQEATSFSRSMHETGLVSLYHAFFLRYILDHNESLIPETLGLSSTGRDSFYSYRGLILKLIENSLFPETCQAVYGLSCLLERGILYRPSLPPSLWRQLNLSVCPEAEQRLKMSFGEGLEAKAFLVSGLISMLGQPLGVGQGDNPTCQSARALFMWSYSDPDYLLHFLTRAVRDNEVNLHFEGVRLSTKELVDIPGKKYNLDLDPVSTVLVPHLDKLYHHMGAMAAGRGEDVHKWVNPELHGWWIGRGFEISVDINTGMLKNFEEFIRRFFATYHPYYNGSRPVIFPQTAGVAVTDSHARFVGWHAISIIRVALDRDNQMRVYFFNPNNDSGQDWGNGVVVSTSGMGEFSGESSLPFNEFLSRLYIYHYDLLELESENEAQVPSDDVALIKSLAHESWAKQRVL